jgi:hypothetical protein
MSADSRGARVLSLSITTATSSQLAGKTIGLIHIAYSNGMDDFKHISSAPVFVANLNVGHGGTFMDPNGGREASVAVSWLDWQLKGDARAAERFVGAACGLCKDPDWNIDSKNLSAANH